MVTNYYHCIVHYYVKKITVIDLWDHYFFNDYVVENHNTFYVINEHSITAIFTVYEEYFHN